MTTIMRVEGEVQEPIGRGRFSPNDPYARDRYAGGRNYGEPYAADCAILDGPAPILAPILERDMVRWALVALVTLAAVGLKALLCVRRQLFPR